MIKTFLPIASRVRRLAAGADFFGKKWGGGIVESLEIASAYLSEKTGGRPGSERARAVVSWGCSRKL